MRGERLEDLFQSSAELGVAFNAVLEGDGEASWLFTYCGTRLERDRLATLLGGLGPVAPFAGRPAAHTHEIEDASRTAGITVLYLGAHKGQASLAACLVGKPRAIRAHALNAQGATGNTAQPVHAQRVELGARPERPHPKE